MGFKEIATFIKNTQSELFDLSEEFFNNDLDNYIVGENELPLLMHSRFEYEYLKEIHFKVYSNIEFIKDFVLYNKFNENKIKSLILKLISLKELTDSLIKSHPDYKPKLFINNFEKLKNEALSKGNFIELNDNLKFKRIKFLKLIYHKLVEMDRISKDATQLKAFKSLFFEDKKTKENIIWKNRVYDLKLFFDLLIDKNIIKPNNKINLFVTNNFKTQEKNENPKSFKTSSYKTSNQKASYQEGFYEWENTIENLALNLGLPQILK